MSDARTTGSRGRVLRLSVAALIAGSFVLAGCYHGRHHSRHHRDYDKHQEHGEHHKDHHDHHDD